MVERRHNGVTIECVQGDIDLQTDVDAVVVTRGPCGILPAPADAGLSQAGRALLASAEGRWIIHFRTPLLDESTDLASQLASCYRNALHLAETNAFASLAIAPLAVDAPGWSLRELARVSVWAVLDEAAHLRSVRHIRFVLPESGDLWIYANTLTDLLERQERA